MSPTSLDVDGAFPRVATLHGSTYRDAGTVVVCPTRGDRGIDHRVVAGWLGLVSPRNSRRAFYFAVGDDVATAYNRLVGQVLATPELARCPFLLTLEDDCVVPRDAHLKLLESIERQDAVSGLYWLKEEPRVPCAFGDPVEYRRTGRMDFRPRDLRAGGLVPCLGIGMGCTLWRMSLFEELPPPWFVTNPIAPDEHDGPAGGTQDLHFCKRLARAGKRLAVDCRVEVEHLTGA